MPMAPDRPFEAFLAAARGAIAHFHLSVIRIRGSNSSPNPNSQQQQQQEPEADCLLQLHFVVTNFLHKPLKSFAWCFCPKPKQRGGKHSPPLNRDAFAHNLHALEDACKQKGDQLGIAARQFEQFLLLRKVIDGKRADFDGFLSNLGFAKVGCRQQESWVHVHPLPQQHRSATMRMVLELGMAMLVVHNRRHINYLPGSLTFLCRMWSACGLRCPRFRAN